jgi:metal-responsive CopG/Arc/MetJ family transcriptional regulator
MATQMVRKQIYLPKRLDERLKSLSKKQGVSEAEIIRQALEREDSAKVHPPYDSGTAIAGILRFAEERLARAGNQEKPRTWKRDEIYEEREGRWTGKKKEG